MSEHWKSTPKYWCKHCSTYVKDTKFERTQHEATGKHQGSLRRFLKGIQDGQERGEREKQRAKAEVDRLNKVVGGSSVSLGGLDAATNKRPFSASVMAQASVTERKKQLGQLAEMGVAVPEDFRGEMAMPGDWKVVSQRPVDDMTMEEPLSVGVRKRKYEGQEDEEEAGGVVARRGWGSTSRRYPGARDSDVPNLDALLSGVKSAPTGETTGKTTPGLKNEEEAEDKSSLLGIKDETVEIKDEPDTMATPSPAPVKKEESAELSEAVTASLHDVPSAEEALGAGVVFKKRKPKSTREK